MNMLSAVTAPLPPSLPLQMLSTLPLQSYTDTAFFSTLILAKYVIIFI